MNIDDNYDNDGTTIETPASNIRPPVLRSASEERDTVAKLVAQVGGRRARNILAIAVGGGRPDGLFNSERGNLWCLIRRGEPKTTRRS
jgi:hypothetical protein